MIDFGRLFTDYRIPYTTKVNKGWINTNCPYCDTKVDSFNMGFSPTDEFCNCWKCGNHDLKDTLSLVLRIPRQEMNGVLRPYLGRFNLSQSSKKIALAKSLSLPGDGFTNKERRYLEKRNYDPDFLHDKYGVVGGGITGKWKFRIIIPIYYNHRLVSWVARSIFSKDRIKELDIPRYKNLSIEESVMNPKDTFFNLDNCRHDEVVLTEGAFDVMRFGDDWLCSLGTQLSQAQLKILCERFGKVYVMFDNEKEAQEKARKFAMQIASMGLEAEVVDAYSEYGVNDGGDCNEEQVREIRQELGL